MAETYDSPKLVNNCNALYRAMEKTVGSDGLWEGKIIDTAMSAGIAMGSYNRVVNALRKLGCITAIEQGSRGKLTAFLLIRPPTAEVWRENAPDRVEDLTRTPNVDIMAAQLEDMRKQLGGINIVDALAELELQIQDLRKRVSALEPTNPQ